MHLPAVQSPQLADCRSASATEPRGAALETQILTSRVRARGAFVGIRITLLSAFAITAVQPLATRVTNLAALGAQIRTSELGRNTGVRIAIAGHARGAGAAFEVLPRA